MEGWGFPNVEKTFVTSFAQNPFTFLFDEHQLSINDLHIVIRETNRAERGWTKVVR